MTKTKDFTVGVVISTYNSPAWLEKVLWGYMYQTRPADEIVIADDGSRDETRLLIESFKGKLPINHVWQPDEGFQKSRILNKALVAATADYLIFTDHDLNRISQETGFSDCSHFIKVFRSIKGVTPGRYRASHRE